VQPDEFDRIFLATSGADLRRIIQVALRMAERNSDNGHALKISLTAALTKIADRSPLRAQRLKSWDFIRPDAH
jgi:hypothetical protein